MGDKQRQKEEDEKAMDFGAAPNADKQGFDEFMAEFKKEVDAKATEGTKERFDPAKVKADPEPDEFPDELDLDGFQSDEEPEDDVADWPEELMTGIADDGSSESGSSDSEGDEWPDELMF